MSVPFKIVSVKGLDVAFARIEREAAEVARGVAIEVFRRALENTPQYFGRMAASWTISYGTPQTYNQVDPVVTTDPKWGKAFWPVVDYSIAIDQAKQRNAGNLDGFRLGQKIYITNGAFHGENYARGIEEGTVPLRDVHQPPAVASYRPLGRAQDAVVATIGRGLSGPDLLYYRTVRIV